MVGEVWIAFLLVRHYEDRVLEVPARHIKDKVVVGIHFPSIVLDVSEHLARQHGGFGFLCHFDDGFMDSPAVVDRNTHHGGLTHPRERQCIDVFRVHQIDQTRDLILVEGEFDTHLR
jgi:hypothetical protein